MANYGTVAGYKAYADARGVSYAAYTDDQILAALVRASSYIDGAYRAVFPGFKTGGRSQALEWPRTGATDAAGEMIAYDEIPTEIESATYEGATRELASPGALAPDVEAGGQTIKREKVGPIEVEYANNGSTRATFAAIEHALSGLFARRSEYSGTAVRI